MNRYKVWRSASGEWIRARHVSKYRIRVLGKFPTWAEAMCLPATSEGVTEPCS